MVDVLKLKALRREWCNTLDQIARIKNRLNSGYPLRNTSRLERRLDELERKELELRSKLGPMEEAYSKDVHAEIRRKANGKTITSRTNVFGDWEPISKRESK